jgi:hypothetical protein
MKLKNFKTTATLAVTLMFVGGGSSLIAQNTFPNNGNVGVGTTTPSVGLDVNRHMMVDSTLTVKDSVRLKSKLTVDQKAVFKENVVVRGQLLRAYHNAKINNNLTVDNKLTVDGVAKLNGIVKMLGINQVSQQVLQNGNYTILLKQQSGNVVEVNPGDLGEILFGGANEIPNPPVGDINPCSGYNSNIYQAAGWMFTPNLNKIYTCNNKVGIGTTTPSHKLDVKGTTKTNKVISKKIQVGYRFFHPHQTDALISGYSIEPSNDIMELGTTGSNGQLTTKFKITHDGTVFVKELRVRPVANFPDYVFDVNYKLKSLYELEEYIKKYKHLPNMPSAKEVTKSGVNVGETQRLLVEKVEELTLYNIQLKHENDALKNELDELKKEVEKIKKSLLNK